MNQRMAGLSDFKPKRKDKGKQLQPQEEQENPPRPSVAFAFTEAPDTPPHDPFGLLPEEFQDNWPLISDVVPSVEFTETPLDDLLALAPEERFSSYVARTDEVRNSIQYSFTSSYQGTPLLDEQVLPSSILQNSPTSKQPILLTPTPSDTNPLIDQRSLSTYVSTSSLKRRLPRYSTQYLKGINRLLLRFSISDTSAVTITQSNSIIPINQQVNNSFLNAGLLLPNAFLRIDHYIRCQGICKAGFRSHDTRSCWCAIMDQLLRQSKYWVSDTGLVMDVADPPRSLQNLDFDFRDSFGNNLLHLLAARGSSFSIIFQAMERVKDVNAKNTASQSFLHVLHDSLLRNLVEDDGYLIEVLQHFGRFSVDFYGCDIFGRSFYHILRHRADSLQKTIVDALSFINAQLPTTRDAFGWTPKFGRNYADKSPDTQKAAIRNFEVLYEDDSSTSDALPTSDAPLMSSDEAILSKHARLLETARLAFDDPSIEDAEGRNGLHCLAEASLDMNISNNSVQPRVSSKRKREQRRREHEQLPLEAALAPLQLRYELVQKMLFVCPSNINSYDHHGSTVLMAFVTHLCDGEDDKILVKLLRFLIRNGANQHRRNRHGETALHIAVRLGRKVATRVLLEEGANVHAMTAKGKGVLALGEKHYLEARDNQQLYASILACMALAIQFGAVAAPTLMQQWSAPC